MIHHWWVLLLLKRKEIFGSFFKKKFNDFFPVVAHLLHLIHHPLIWPLIQLSPSQRNWMNDNLFHNNR